MRQCKNNLKKIQKKNFKKNVVVRKINGHMSQIKENNRYKMVHH